MLVTGAILSWSWDRLKSKLPEDEQRAVNKSFIKIFGVPLLFILILGLMQGLIQGAFAQTINRTYQNPMGQNIGRSTTDPQGRTTFYDNMGKNTGRSVTNGNTTTFYDNMGRETGRSNAR
jgi:hypothetical protein